MRFFPTFLGSFYSAETYREVRQSRGHGLAYTLLLVTLITLISVTVATILLHRIVFTTHYGPVAPFDEVVKQISEQVPVMTLKDNRLKTQEPRIHTIHIQTSFAGHGVQGDIATIDTTGETTYESMQTPILITDKEIVMKGRETKIKSFSEIQDGKNYTMVFNQSMAQELAQELISFVHTNLVKFYFFIGLLCSIFIIIIYYIQRLIMSLALSIGGILLGQCLKTKVDFETGMRMAAVSYTPVVCLDIICMFLQNGRSASALYLFICGLIMLGASLYVTRDTPLADPASFA